MRKAAAIIKTDWRRGMRRVLTASVAVLFLFMAGSALAVVIDEFYYGTEPPGDNEWVELYNISAGPIDLNNWQIAVANGGPFQVIHTITTGRMFDAESTPTEILSQGYFLVTDGAGLGGVEDVNGVNLNLGRDTGGDVLGIALIDDLGTTIDTVLYGPGGAANTYLLVDDDGSSDPARAKGVLGDQTYTRFQHGDTNDSSVDFAGTGSPTGTPLPVEVSRFVVD